MKKTIFKRGFIFIIAVVIILSSSAAAFASGFDAQLQQDNVVTPFFIGINTITYDFDLVSGQANPKITGTTLPDAVDTVTVKVDLKRGSGSAWTTIKSWSKNVTISLDKFTFNEKYGVSSGYSYKYTATVKSYKDGVLLDSVTFDSSTIKY